MPLFMPPENRTVTSDKKLIFLIGPIQGADDWQNPTAEWFLERMPDLFIASPRSGMWEQGLSKEEHDRRFVIQADWEHQYIEQVLMRIVNREENSAIFAWCPKEAFRHPRRAYGQTTRFELGTIVGWLDGFRHRYPLTGICRPLPPTEPVFIGADPEFSGRQYLHHTLTKNGRRLYSSLDELRAATLTYLRART